MPTTEVPVLLMLDTKEQKDLPVTKFSHSSVREHVILVTITEKTTRLYDCQL
jgi:hypothetical protein